MGLQGSLKEFSPVELLQLLATGKKTCELRIVSSAGEAHVFFDKGAVVHAAFRDIAGEGVLPELVGWTDGSFETLTVATAAPRSIEKDLSTLILSALKQNAEQRAAKSERGKRQTQPVLTTEQSVLDQWIQNGGGSVLHVSVFDSAGAVRFQATDRERAPDGVAALHQMATGLLGSYPRRGLRRVLMDDALGIVALTRLDDARFLMILAAAGTQPGALSLWAGKIAAQLATVEALK